MLKTILIFFVVGLAMIIPVPLGLLFFIFSFLGIRAPLMFLIYRIAQGWARMLIFLTGCKLTVTGREHIPRKGGLCIVSNHGSIFDILLHLAYVGRPLGFIAKKELLAVPFLNMWIFLLGGLFIDRKNIRQAVKTINKGVERIKAGGVMIVFPEGTRSKGQGLLPFHPGSLKLATQSLAPVIPAAISGSYDVFERNYRVNAVPVTVAYGALIATDRLPAEGRTKNLSDEAREAIRTVLEPDVQGFGPGDRTKSV
ncbi:MAG: 1-acyl-sn-glycerol-3-phosphate acyltransferase [Treponema sp.]|jgi:1-acyl-sn-glycerol-3-phosphate acyltransferase|nr:1-acyl-sn-glycerol-3-phosphate acyltransferase [Treponema sp.]